MKKTIVALSVIIFIFGFTYPGFCADSFKVGVIDFQKILKESSAGKMTQKQIKAKGDEFQKKLLDEKNMLDEMKKTFEREALVLSPEKQQEKQREFRIKVNDFKKMQQNFTQQFKQLEVKLLNGIQKEVFEIANTLGEKEKFQLIVEKKTAGVIFYQGELDITDEIIKQYNLKISKAN
jgi:outer membrane protein